MTGERKGKIEGKIEVARNLLADGISPEVVARNTGLPLAEVIELRDNPNFDYSELSFN
jgi:predicted transposase/invertase (TIGR01784 family)